MLVLLLLCGARIREQGGFLRNRSTLFTQPLSLLPGIQALFNSFLRKTETERQSAEKKSRFTNTHSTDCAGFQD